MVFRLNERSRINEDYFRTNERSRSGPEAGIGIAGDPAASVTIPHITGTTDEDLLSLSYPAFAPRIGEARSKGFSDDEIEKTLTDRREAALASGFDESEINSALGITRETRMKYIRTVLAGRDELDAVMLGMSPDELAAAYEQARKAGVPRSAADAFTSRQRMSHESNVSLLSDYVDIAEDRQKSGKEYDRGKYSLDVLNKDAGPRFEWNRSVNEAVSAGTNNTLKRTLGGMTVGFLSSTEGIARGGAYLAHVLGWQEGFDSAANFADLIADGTDEFAALNYKGINQNLWDAAMQGIGSQAAFLIPGIFARSLMMAGQGARALTVGKRFVGTLANLTGAAISGTTESLSEAGTVYEEVLKRTGDESAAATGAAWTFWLNMPSNFLSDKLAFFGEDTILTGWIPKLVKASPRMQNVLYRFAKGLAGAASEGTQETFQGTVSEHFVKGTEWTNIDLSEIAFEQGIPGAIVGAVFGAGMARGTFKEVAARVETERKTREFQQKLKDVSGVMSGVREKLAATSYDDATKTMFAGIWAARASAAAKQQGISPMEWFSRHSLSVEEISGPDVDAEAGTLNQNSFQKKNMKETMAEWGRTVDDILSVSSSRYSRSLAKIMDSPLVFSLVGGHYADVTGKKLGVYINESKLPLIIKDHPNIDSKVLKNIPRSMADPIAVFSSNEGTPGESVVFMLDIKDNAGSSVIASLWFDRYEHGFELNKVSSVYGKDDIKNGKTVPRDDWFKEQTDKQKLLYVNKKKASRWAGQTGLQFLPVDLQGKPLIEDSLPTENDLVKLRRENPTYYQHANITVGNFRQDAADLEAKYNSAITNNNMGEAQDIVAAYAALNGYTQENGYKGSHRAPYNDPEGDYQNIIRLAENDGEMAPTDYFDHPEHYIILNEEYSPESLRIIKSVLEETRKFNRGKRKKEPEIWVYRAVNEATEEGSPRNADWVTPSKTYAKLHGDSVLNGKYKIQKIKAKVSDLYWDANDINEWGYDDGSNYAYKNTPNNRKLFDAVVRDDQGNIVPLSQRFQDKRAQVYLQTNRGSVTFNNGSSLIRLFQSHDRSTFLHESGHIFLKDFSDYISTGKASAQDLNDWQTFLDWSGVKSWDNATDEEYRRAHEMFARGMEMYFWEGKAPSPGLARLFRQFSLWLREIYRGAEDFNVNMTPEVRSMFDHLFGMDEAGETVVMRETGDIEIFDQTGQEPEKTGKEDIPAAEEEPKYDFQEITREELIMDSALDGDEDALSDPVLKPEGEETKASTDEERFNAEVQAFADFSRDILANGGLLYDGMEEAKRQNKAGKRQTNLGVRALEGMKEIFGPEKARDIYLAAQELFKAGAPAVSELAARMGISVEEIVNRILKRPAQFDFEKFYPLAYVNIDSYSWLVNRMGSERAAEYFRKRAALLQDLITTYDKYLERDPSKYTLETETYSYLKRQAQNELEYIEKTALVRIADEMSSGQGVYAPMDDILDWKEFTKYAAKQEREISRIENLPENTKVIDLVAERAQTKRELNRMKTIQRESFKAGSKSAAMFMRQKQKSYEEKIRERAEIRGKVQSLLWRINHASGGNLRCDAKQEIVDILEGYNLNRGGYFQMPGDKPSKFNTELLSVRDAELAELNEYLAISEEEQAKKMSGLGSDFSLDTLNLDQDLAELSKTMLCEMTLEDLETLEKRLSEIKKRGEADFAQWKSEQEEELKVRWKDPLTEAMSEKVGSEAIGDRQDGVILPGRTKRGMQVGKITKALINTLNPSRVFDLMDGYMDFRGVWHTLFKRSADNAEDSFLRNKNRRVKNLENIMAAHEITEDSLREERMKFTGADGNEVVFSLDDCLFIYAGWHNRFTKDALKYGNHISDSMATSIFASLTDTEKNFAAAVCKETSDEFGRYQAVMQNVYNVSVTNEPWYTRMYRAQWTDAGGEIIDEGIKGILKDTARQFGLRKLYADRGSSYSRKVIPMAYQEPISIGIMKVWSRSMMEHEHLTAYGKLVRQMHSVIGEKTDYSGTVPIIGMKEAIIDIYGTEASEFLLDYVNILGNPDFYKSYKLLDKSFRALRANLGIAYLWNNISSIAKQPTALAYYLQDAGINNILSSMAEFVAAPQETMEKVWAMDPQVKEQQINMFLEMLKKSETQSERQLKLKKFAESGFKLMEWTDMMTRVIGWNAVYKKELADGKSKEDAIYRAQLVTLNTQNAVHPKELPRYMKSGNEFMNLALQFTNQANKIFGVMAHDLYGDIKKGRVHHGFATLMGLLLAALFMSWIEKGKVPTTGEEFVKDIVVEKSLGNIPFIGAGFIAASTKFQGGATPLDTIAGEIYRAGKGAFEGEYEDVILGVYTGYSMASGGLPVTAVKRTLKFARTGKLSDLTGLMRETGKKKRKVIP